MSIELVSTADVKIMVQKIALSIHSQKTSRIIFKVKEMPVLDDSLNSVNAKKKQASDWDAGEEVNTHLNVLRPEMLMYKRHLSKNQEMAAKVLADTEASTQYIDDHMI
ncbi:uncharacterized protein BDCG_17773 [Blastomyces dermatitidis ER-3]|uniref:Tubulin-specific chaperone A n=1 Tax=Ajellomyces dermatitidis (strain ER-3 / ATCC MYA-2586) TaxID=559297 RepID=A0ABX2W080_AJEDR|nr:uncharacterized protein BDCG_17773 [Blastomyces dermatitidis ER-3]OAT02790.1 hypothetical protein BDCG_17773 [Blastomyces dermatitidis ER-3]